MGFPSVPTPLKKGAGEVAANMSETEMSRYTGLERQTFHCVLILGTFPPCRPCPFPIRNVVPCWRCSASRTFVLSRIFRSPNLQGQVASLF